MRDRTREALEDMLDSARTAVRYRVEGRDGWFVEGLR
jgi:hypothetical protein